MKTKIDKSVVIVSGLFFMMGLAACNAVDTSNTGNITGSTESTETTSSDTSVANAAASGINSANQTLQTSNLGLSTSTAAALDLNQNGELRLSRGCKDNDDVTVTISCDDTNHTASIIRDFGQEGCKLDDNETKGGQELHQWTNMGNSSCSSRTGRPEFWSAVQGQPGANADLLVSTDPDSPKSPKTPLVHTYKNGNFVNMVGYSTVDYSNFQVGTGNSVDSTLNIPGTSRIAYKKDGVTKVFDHTISTTPSDPMKMTLEKDKDKAPIRTIHSGELNVSHNLAKFTVSEDFTEVKYDYNECECHPVSGTIAIKVTDNTTSRQIGSGTLTFTGSTTGECGSVNVTYEGRSIKFPKLDRCR